MHPQTQAAQLDLFDLLFQTVESVRPPEPTFPATSSMPIISSVMTQPARMNYRIPAEAELVPHGQKAKLLANLNVIRLLKQLRAEERAPGDEECGQLIRYAGWGGIPQVFDPRNQDFARYHVELKELLTVDEYSAAQASTLSAHYTPKYLIEFMWQLARHCGFTGGEVAELGAGIGHFIGLLPAELAETTRFTAVELDSISSRILTTLYPQVKLHPKSLEKIHFPINLFDLVIGNVPFSKIGVYDRKFENYNLHNYFIARGLEALKPGGLCIILTSSSTLESGNTTAREYFYTQAALLGAIRLPNNTFMETANTEVVSDLLVFQKGARRKTPMIKLVEVDTGDDTGKMLINEYFADHFINILGVLSNTGHMYGKVNTPTVTPLAQRDINQMLAERMGLFHAEKIEHHPCANSFFDVQPQEETIELPYPMREYAVFCQEDRLYQVQNEQGQLILDRAGKPLSGNERQKGLSFIRLKNTLNDLLRRQIDPYAEDAEIEEQRRILNTLYDEHVGRFGFLNNKLVHKKYIEDQDYLKLSATEYPETIIDETLHGIKTKRQIYVKGDIYHKRTQWPWREPEEAADAVEAGLISHAYRHKIDLPYVKTLLKLSSVNMAEKAILATGEFFKNPVTQQIELKSKYLSNNVVDKLEIARAAAKINSAYAVNVAALEKVQPVPLQIDSIDFQLGSYWIPDTLISQWIKDTFNDEIEVRYLARQDKWIVNSDFRQQYQHSEYRIGNYHLYSLLEATLNLQEPTVHKEVFEAGEKKTYVDQEATLTVRQYKKNLIEQFRQYVLDNFSATQELETVYNSLFNRHVLREYKQPSFDIYPGAVSIVNGKEFFLRTHQKWSVTRCLEENTLLAHYVGSGKTAIIVSAAMELRRLKLATKCLIVVLNSTLAQFAEFAPRLYPEAHILMADKKDLVKEKRKRFLTRIATGDWDMIIMAQSSFDMLQNDPNVVKAHYQSQINELETIIDEAEDRGAVKDIERQKKQLEKQLEKMSDQERVENIVYFEELGIDALFIDEAHNYKRNMFVTKKGRIKGLDRSASRRAFNLTLKIKHIMEKTGGRNIILATGTPVANTLAELWNMIRYVSPQTLDEYGVETFDRFASTFTTTETALEIDAAGRFKMVERFAKYCNVVELSKMFRNCADVVLSEDLKEVERPPIKGGKPEKVTIQRSPVITQMMHYLSDIYNWYEHETDKRRISHIPLLIYGMSRKCTIDPRLVCSRFPDDPASKLSVCAGKVVEKYREYSSIKGAQIIFMDLYRNAAQKTVLFDAWEELRKKLIVLGIPPEEIATANDAVTDKQRNDLFAKVNSGEVRVIIGSTARLGTGVNIQERLAVAHHIDAPFRPADMEQRNGRIIRQGSVLTEVEIIQYGIEQTLDAGMYQILERKQKFINDAMMGRGGRSIVEQNDAALDYASFSAIISGNEQLQRKVVVETRLKELTALENQYRRNNRHNIQLRDELRTGIPLFETHLKTFERYCSTIPAVDWKYADIHYGELKLEGTQQEIIDILHRIMLEEGLYRSQAFCRSQRRNICQPMKPLIINGIKFELFAFCDYRELTGVDYDNAHVLFQLDVPFREAMNSARLQGRISNGKKLYHNIRNLIDELPARLAKCQRELEIMKVKYNSLLNLETKGFPQQQEYDRLRTELTQLLNELNKTNPEFGNEEVIHDCPRFADYFPDLTDVPTDVITVEAEYAEDDGKEDDNGENEMEP